MARNKQPCRAAPEKPFKPRELTAVPKAHSGSGSGSGNGSTAERSTTPSIACETPDHDSIAAAVQNIADRPQQRQQIEQQQQQSGQQQQQNEQLQPQQQQPLLLIAAALSFASASLIDYGDTKTTTTTVDEDATATVDPPFLAATTFSSSSFSSSSRSSSPISSTTASRPHGHSLAKETTLQLAAAEKLHPNKNNNNNDTSGPESWMGAKSLSSSSSSSSMSSGSGNHVRSSARTASGTSGGRPRPRRFRAAPSLVVASTATAATGKIGIAGVTLLCVCAAAFCCASSGVRRTVHFWRLFVPMVAEYQWLVYRTNAQRRAALRLRALRDCSSQPSLQRWRHESTLSFSFAGGDSCVDADADDEAASIDAALAAFHDRTAPAVHAAVVQLGGIFIKLGQLVSTVGPALVPDAYVQALRPLLDGVPPRRYAEIAAILEAATGRSMHDLFVEFDPNPLGAASIAQAHRAVLRHADASSSSSKNDPVVIKVQYPDVAALFDIDFTNVRALARIINPENLHVLDSLKKRHEQELDFTVEADNLRLVRRNMQAHGVEPSLVRIPKVRNETGVCSRTVLAIEFLPGVSVRAAIADEQQRVAVALGMRGGAAELRQVIAARMMTREAHADLESPFHAYRANLLQTFGPTVARVLRAYGTVKLRLERVWRGTHDLSNARHSNVNLGRALQTLVHVHGLQMLHDGVFNVDPHPGNVLIMPDGRLGLLDYGMVGRVTDEERLLIATTVVALASKNKAEVVRLYTGAGYRAVWKRGRRGGGGGPVTDPNILHRFASFNLDRMDLSPVTTQENERVDIRDILHAVIEVRLPTWVEKSRRMGALMLGTAWQAARPMSLSHEWGAMARQVVAAAARAAESTGASSLPLTSNEKAANMDDWWE